jgi:hypothetical protein
VTVNVQAASTKAETMALAPAPKAAVPLRLDSAASKTP